MNSLSEHIRSLSRSSTTPQTLIDIAEDVQELEAENARLNTELKLSKKDAAFYKSCALSGGRTSHERSE
jgi:cell shape-determining protein MreC